MILSGKEIVKHMGKEIVIEPFDKSRVNPNSYNLSLYNELMVYDSKELDMAKPNSASVIKIPEDGFVLQP
ncbi:MAG: dCTP deaminase, partial [Megasphaera micronuciformis]|nr:dCTP deaminase [Megasphaera micronuciformis]